MLNFNYILILGNHCVEENINDINIDDPLEVNLESTINASFITTSSSMNKKDLDRIIYNSTPTTSFSFNQNQSFISSSNTFTNVSCGNFNNSSNFLNIVIK